MVISGDWLAGGDQVLSAINIIDIILYNNDNNNNTIYQVITGGWDRLATIWAADTGQCVQQLAGHDDQVRMELI